MGRWSSSDSEASNGSQAPSSKKKPLDSEPKHLDFDGSVNSSCQELQKHMEFIDKISEGTFGVIYKARDLSTEKTVALKKFKIVPSINKTKIPEESIKEINILLSISHENVLKAFQLYHKGDPPQFYLSLDFFKHELKELIENKPEPFAQSEIKNIINQVLNGLDYLHNTKGIIHRDIKTANLLYDNSGKVVIGDLGSATHIDKEKVSGRTMTDLVITLNYRPPELLLGTINGAYGTEVDVWSVGCVLAELLQNAVFFQGTNEKEQIDFIIKTLGSLKVENLPQLMELKHTVIPYYLDVAGGYSGRYSVSNPSIKYFLDQKYENKIDKLFPLISVTSGSYLTKIGVDLLQQMLMYNPVKRISVREALDHPWFTQPPKPRENKHMPKFLDNYKNHKRKRGEDIDAGAKGLFSNTNKYLI